MPRGTTFGELVTMFREEAGYAVNPNLGQNELPHIKTLLRREYRRLHADFEWPHLKIEREETLQAGQRYYSFPQDIDHDNIYKVWVRENGEENWYPLHYGIGLPHYNTVASDQGEREDFPYAWQIYENEQFEVWPIPVDNGHTVKFYARSRAKDLVNEGDTVDLDDDLVVMYAAARKLARDKSADAQILMQEARQHYMRLRGNSQHGEPVDMQVNRDRKPRYYGVDIRYAELRD